MRVTVPDPSAGREIRRIKSARKWQPYAPAFQGLRACPLDPSASISSRMHPLVQWNVTNARVQWLGLRRPRCHHNNRSRSLHSAIYTFPQSLLVLNLHHFAFCALRSAIRLLTFKTTTVQCTRKQHASKHHHQAGSSPHPGTQYTSTHTRTKSTAILAKC